MDRTEALEAEVRDARELTRALLVMMVDEDRQWIAVWLKENDMFRAWFSDIVHESDIEEEI